jgi:hypothetical protein
VRDPRDGDLGCFSVTHFFDPGRLALREPVNPSKDDW